MRFIFSGHEIDLHRQELHRRGEMVRVEPQVFDLLAYLVQHRNRVVGKDELFGTIWKGRIVSDTTLSSRIKAARKAIGDDGERQELIRTLHRRGFRFIGEVEERQEEANPATYIAATTLDSRDADRGYGVSIIGQSESRKPRVVVTPVTNLSTEPDTEYFSYGLTEDVIRLLARNRWLDVLSRHSAQQYRGREFDAREVGATLGARYIVQGSVWKRSERVRITADLICAETGQQLWSEAYQLKLDDIFDVQVTMAQQIAAIIEPELARVERELAMRKPPSNLDAWDCYQRGYWHLWGFTTPGLEQAIELLHRALDLDPAFARAYGALAYVLVQKAYLNDAEARPALLDAAMRSVRTALLLDQSDCMLHCVLGRAHVMLHNHEEGIAALEHSIQLNPSFAQAYFALGHAMVACGRAHDALPLLARAVELSPRDPHLSIFYDVQALAHLSLGDLDAALASARRAVRLPNATYLAFVTLVATLGLLGRVGEAASGLAELFRRKPGYTQSRGVDDLFFCRNELLLQRFLEGLRLVGVPQDCEARSGTV